MTFFEAYATFGTPLILLMIGFGAAWWVRRTTPDPELSNPRSAEATRRGMQPGMIGATQNPLNSPRG
jgi:hypothetical protein